jgi:hypothetical protein
MTATMLRLALFGANCSSGRTYATLPERWVASWENNRKLAQLADEIGIEAMVPIARWKGYGGASNPNGTSFESIAWASGLLAATGDASTLHRPRAPAPSPRRRQTDGHGGSHRSGTARRQHRVRLNEDEFQMFGVTKKEYDVRYEQGERSGGRS